MAVLIEGISVVIRCDSIMNHYFGGIKGFQQAVPNATLTSDGDLACVSFMMPDDAKKFVQLLEVNGLKHLDQEEPIDIVIVDQVKGLCSECHWASFGKHNYQGDPEKPVSACQAVPTKADQFFTPKGWNYEKSLSANFQFVASGEIPDHLKFLRKENNVEVYLDEQSGEEVYVGRTGE